MTKIVKNRLKIFEKIINYPLNTLLYTYLLVKIIIELTLTLRCLLIIQEGDMMKKNHPILITVIVFIMLLNILMPLETIAEYNPDKSDQVLEENQPTSETTPPTEKTEDLIEKNTEALPKETATHEEWFMH